MYYSVEHTVSKETGNVFPQISFINQEDAFEIVDYEFTDIPRLKAQLEHKAKITDVLSQASIGGHGLLICEKLKTIFEKFNIMQHKYYPVEVQTKKGSLPYYWLQVNDRSLLHKINYKKSVFYWTETTFKQGIIELNSYADYVKKKKEHENDCLWGIDIEEIVLTKNFDRDLDVFCFSPLDGVRGFFISERLKNAIDENKITGIEIKEALISFE